MDSGRWDDWLCEYTNVVRNEIATKPKEKSLHLFTSAFLAYFWLLTVGTNELILVDTFFICNACKMVAKEEAPTLYPLFSVNLAVAAVRCWPFYFRMKAYFPKHTTSQCFSWDIKVPCSSTNCHLYYFHCINSCHCVFLPSPPYSFLLIVSYHLYMIVYI